jgi:polyphosphate kinase
VPLEDIVSHNLDMLLPEMEILSCELFRVTRNANTERNEEHADDLLAMIESELRDRRFAPIVGMQVQRGWTRRTGACWRPSCTWTKGRRWSR